MTRPDDPPPCEFRKRLQAVVERRGAQFKSISDLGLQAGLAKATLTNRLLAAEKAGEEPVFDTRTLERVAGVGRVSLSWLMGIGKDIDAPDVPPAPKVSPTEIARRRLGGENSELARLRAENRELRRQLQQREKR